MLQRRTESTDQEFKDKVIRINRVAKVVKGGRRFGFAALVAVGDGNGRVGIAIGKAREVAEAVRKAMEHAKRQMITIPLQNGTIPHPVNTRFSGGHIIMKPARPGTGIIAGGAMRAVLEVSGVHDVVAKSLGSDNAVNIVKATMKGLQSLRDPQQWKEMLHPEKAKSNEEASVQ